VGPEGKVSQNFGSRGLERKESSESLVDLKPRNPMFQNPRSVENESFENPKIAEPHEISENLFESKCLLFLFVLAYKC
jgi:hypothetical protein